MPPGPWRVVGNKILAGNVAVAVVVSTHAHAVAEGIVEVVNADPGTDSLIDELQAKVKSLTEEIESLRNPD